MPSAALDLSLLSGQLPVSPADLTAQVAAAQEALAGIDLDALAAHLSELAAGLPASLGDLQTWLPGAISQVGSLSPDLLSSLTDLQARLEQGVRSVESLRGAAERTADSFREVQDRLRALDAGKFVERGPMQDPGKPVSGRQIFPSTTTDDKARGESWAKMPARPSVSFKAGATVASSLSPGDVKSATSAEATGDPLVDAATYVELLGRNPSLVATGSGEIQFRSPRFDLSVGALAGASGSVQGDDAADFFKAHRSLPDEIKAVGDRSSALDVGRRLAALDARMRDIQAQAEALRARMAGNSGTAEYPAAIQAALVAIADARSAAAEAGSLLAELDRFAGDARLVSDKLQDQTRRITLDLAGGGVGRIRLTGRTKLPSPTGVVSDLTLGVSGQLVMAAENPAYQPDLADRPQLRYTLGAIRSRATAWLEGTDRLRALIDGARNVASATQGAVVAADSLLAGLQQTLQASHPVALDLADLSALLAGLQQQLAGTLPELPPNLEGADPAALLSQLSGPAGQQALAVLGQTDVPALLARLQALRQQMVAIPLPDPALADRVGQELDRVDQANQALLADIGALEAGFRVKADLTTRVVQPTSPFGAGVGLGLAGTLHVGHPVDFALTADNLAGIMPGVEETWRLRDPREGGGTFEKVGEKRRNVYGDFFPPTYRLALASTLGATTLRADWEKVAGLPGINQLYGIDQGIGKYVRARAGAEKAAAYGRDWAPYLGLEIGPRQGWAVWLTGSADSFSTESLHQGNVSAGLRIDF